VARISLAMLNAGLSAYRDWNPDNEDEAALVWAILSRALAVGDFSSDDLDQPSHVRGLNKVVSR
jgi:hypothetical protein